MAKHEVPDNHIGFYGGKLLADTVDEVSFADSLSAVEVSVHQSATVYFTTDGTTPTVGGTDTHEIPEGALSRTVTVRKGPPTVVRLVSSDTPEYSVARVNG